MSVHRDLSYSFFNCCIVFFCVDVVLFSYSLVYGHLSCLQYFASTNNAAMNNLGHIYSDIDGDISSG